ncbi:DUF1566 domain-containing protein [Desulfovibrio sulfodismutans]|uniref:DUF1566 domain-containing protein n=2 Tax=Desulfolutivibrio sulfodismutans TaxID=63561 RepID=A0A7K3NG17_9BACT|nr:DUF1566 domain-containing protein [Desulfolutivibrio sulfodismutans]NDY55130.1 DUF1566 domain-containing protein [Desulfolutivibrio sulfodismutans]
MLHKFYIFSLAMPILLYCAQPAVASFVDNGLMVLDQSTGLQWEKGQSDSEMAWEQALSYCEARTTGGVTDWRLPNKKELESLVDDTRINPALDPLFPAPGSSVFWTTTTAIGYDFFTYAWIASLNTGTSYTQVKTWGGRVRCVRGESGEQPMPIESSNMLLLNME